jgi:predicted short-subunit dehydrogenase-like oxidoreductase (DUF2520 family)
VNEPLIDPNPFPQTCLTLVGSGQAAWALGWALHGGGIQIDRVVARPNGRGTALAQRLGASWVPWSKGQTLPKSAPPAPGQNRVTLLAVSDDALPEVASFFGTDQTDALVHCSGTRSLEDLMIHPVRGVFWPILNLSKADDTTWKGAPILIQTEEASLRQTLHHWAQRIGATARDATEVQRQKLHLAAVMTANFNNVLLHWGHLLTQGGGTHQDLFPILVQQLNLFEQNPQDPLTRQSGPAWRGDQQTVDSHLRLLQDDPEGIALYRWFSSLIQRLRDQSPT